MLRRAFPALSEPAIGRYLGGQLSSVTGTWVQNTVMSLLLWQLTHSAATLGLYNFLLQAPMLAVPLLAGAHLSPQSVRAATFRILLCSLALSLVLLTGAALHILTATYVLIVAGLLGLVSSMEMPARQLLLTSSLKDRSLLVNAVAMNTLVFNVGRMIGPAAGAAVFAHGGATLGLFCSICGISVMLFCVHGLPRTHPDEADERGDGGGIREAFRFVRHDSFARFQVPALACIGLFCGSYQTLIPVLAAREFGSVEHFTGLFFACAGAGSFSAALVMSVRPASDESAGLLWLSRCLCLFALTGLALSPFGALSGVCFWALGLGISLSTTQINATLQRRAPPHLRGGVVGLYAVSFLGTMPIGHLLMGTAASHWGPKAAFAMMAAVNGCFFAVLALLARRRGSKA